MRKLSNADYVLWDKSTDKLLRYSDGDIVIYSDRAEVDELKDIMYDKLF